MTFGIFVAYDSYFKPVADITMPVLSTYCDRHGYSLRIEQDPPVRRTVLWDRALRILANMDRFDWTVHFDADILVTNPDISLERIVAQFPLHRDLIVSRDHTGLNDGIIFNRNTARCRQLWEWLFTMTDEHPSAMAAMWQHVADNPLQTVLGEVPQKLFNAYPYPEYGIEYPEGTWAPGDFAYHLPGMTTERRAQLLRAMTSK